MRHGPYGPLLDTLDGDRRTAAATRLNFGEHRPRPAPLTTPPARRWLHGWGSRIGSGGRDVDDETRWSIATRGIVVIGAECAVTTDRPLQEPLAMSVVVAGQVSDTDVVIAQCHLVPVAHGTTPAEHGRNMTVAPLRLDTLSGLPSVTVRAKGLTESVTMDVYVQLLVGDDAAVQDGALACRLDGLALSTATPWLRIDWPAPMRPRS
jgi:hypothetical protein